MASSGAGSGGQQSRSDVGSSRYSNLIYDSEVFLTKLREFKPQSLGCLEARRKSSSTLIFPNPLQACMGPPKCSRYPHDVKPTPGYWIECHGPGPLAKSVSTGVQHTSQSEHAGRLPSEDLNPSEGCQASTSRTSDRSPSAKADDLRLVIECPSRSSAGSNVSQHFPTTPTAERIITRHEKDIKSDRDEMDEDLREKAVERMQSIEFTDSCQTPRGLDHRARDFSRIGHESLDLTTGGFADIASSSSKITSDTDGQGGGFKTGYANSKNTGESRKRLSKRTMTRDDIDLHKPRRGTPNITITEPSFNQSTVTYNPSARSRFGTRQDSQSPEIRRLDSIDSSCEPIPPEQPTKAKKFQAQTSVESANYSVDTKQLSKQDSLSSEEPQSAHDAPSLIFKPFRQHRPSIIREDADQEGEPGEIQEKGEYHCGLSTTTFQKKSFHQIPPSPQNQETQDQFKDGSLELISFEEENYEKHYYGREHWNYFTNDEMLGPVMLSLKQEVNNQRDHFHVLLRTVSYTLHGTIPASTICADRYDKDAIVRELSEIAKLKPPLMLGQLPSTPDDLLKLDHIFIKTELKVGVIYIKQGQADSEEAILGNKEESPLFTEFLDLLGDRITLKGFDRYKGGLDTVHNLTGTESVYTMWRNIEIMFHVSTMLPHEENDPQKLQKKRHIGNDIVCVAFIESDDTLFWPGCIKSYFLHTFIIVRTSPKPLKEGEKRKYSVSCVCRNEVQYAFKPYLVEQDEFFKSDYFREWLLVKIVNGERASYSAPKFARMQDRTRSQLLEDIITNLANHLVTGQIPKPYRRGSWRPLGHTRASSPLDDLTKDYFEDYDQLAKDFNNAFCGSTRSMLCDVVFKVKDKDGTYKPVHGVRAILAIRSRIFLEMLYGFVPPGAGPSGLQNQTNLRAIEMKALSGEFHGSSNKELDHTKSLLAKRGSFGADSGKKTSEKERRQSMLPNLSKSISQKPNYLTVPNAASDASGGSGTGGMIKSAFNRLVSGNWSSWSSAKGYKGELTHIKVDPNKGKVDPYSLAICKELSKLDLDRLSQREFEIKEFDFDTFQQTIEYIHNGQCKLSYETIPGLICAAEHYDLPDLLHACFHHANTHMKLGAAPRMMNQLFQSSCFYITAMQLLDTIYEFIDPQGDEFFSRSEYLELDESVFTALLSRKTLQISELKRFQAMHGWARQQVSMKRQQKQQLQLQKQQSSDQQERQQDQLQLAAATSGGVLAAALPMPQQPHQHQQLQQQQSQSIQTKISSQQQQITDRPIASAAVTMAASSSATTSTMAPTATAAVAAAAASTAAAATTAPTKEHLSDDWAEKEYKNLMIRLNKEVNIKLDKISNEDLVKVVLPTKVFNNDKVFEVMADESRID